MTLVNTQCRLAARPVGLPKPTDWTFTEEPVPSPADGELLVRVGYLSIDPAMRTWMNAGRSYVPPVEIVEVMRADVNDFPEILLELFRGENTGKLVLALSS